MTATKLRGPSSAHLFRLLPSGTRNWRTSSRTSSRWRERVDSPQRHRVTETKKSFTTENTERTDKTEKIKIKVIANNARRAQEGEFESSFLKKQKPQKLCASMSLW